MEREVVAAVRRHPEGAAVTVAGASAHMAGAVMAAGEEQWRQSRGACSKKRNEGWGGSRAWGTACMGIQDGETNGYEDEWGHY